MTSNDAAALHPTDEALADRQEGLLPADEVTALDTHVAGCVRCSDRAAALRDLSARLAGDAVTEAVPGDVADRVDRALAQARLRDQRTIVPAPADESRTTLPMRLLQVAAVLVLLLAGVGVVAGSLGGRGADDAGSTTSADSEAADAGTMSAEQEFPVSQSGTNWSPETLTEQVPAIVNGTLPGGTSLRGSDDAAEAPAAGRATRLLAGPALGDCVTGLNGAPVTPLGVDVASWQGDPATVIVLPSPGEPAEVEVWVVAPDCSQADAKVLFFAHATRP
jgi:hypothetical protein